MKTQSKPQPVEPSSESATGNRQSDKISPTQSAIGNRQSKKIITLPPELSALTPEQLEYINDRLRAQTYAEVQELLFTDMGIRISINKLFRYYQKLELADQLEIAADSNEAVEQLLNLYNGQPVDLDKAGLETIKRRALQLAVSPSTKPSLLLNLMRIFTWEHRKSMDDHRKSMNDHRKQIDHEKSAHHKRLAAVAERRAKCEEDRVKILERREAHLEKGKPASSDFPQAQITQLLQQELSQPWSPPAPNENSNTATHRDLRG